MKIQFEGAVQTVTGSQTLIRNGRGAYLVDCGLYQGPKLLREKNWNPAPYIRDVRAILLTHAHIDHSGLLPRWYKWGWRGPVFCTPATADLLRIMLPDAARLQMEDAEFANKTKHSRHIPALALYTEKDAVGALSLLETLPYQTWKELDQHFSFRFFRASHILGSASLQISAAHQNGSTRLTMSGDLGSRTSPILKESADIGETDFLVLESTYGNRKVEALDREAQLGEIVTKVINRQGTLVIPAFAVGRTQDILYGLYSLRSQNKIPACPIYLDSPMATSVTDVYVKYQSEMKSSDVVKALSSSFYRLVESPDESMLLCMSEEPKIIVSASGMLQGGRVLHHLKRILPDSRNGVLFVGFQGSETKGRLLQSGLKSLRVHHQEVSVDAEIFTLDGYSAHADQERLIDWVKHFKKPPREIFLNHGEPESSKTLKKKLETLGFRTRIPRVGEIYDLDF